MTNCGKGKANTVHPECIGEQHYSDDHGTGSAIKMAKAPDVDLEKGDGQAAPDPTVANALEKAGRDEGVPSKKGRELKPFKGKIEKMPFEGRNDNYPKGYTERKVPIKGMSLNQTPKQTHQDTSGSAPEVEINPATNKPYASKPRPAPKASREERSARYKEAAEADKADLDFWQRATDIYNEMPGSKGNWDAHLFRTIYNRMFDEKGNYTGYKSDNPAFVNAVKEASKQADWMNERDASIAQSNDEALHPENYVVPNSKRAESDEFGRLHPDVGLPSAENPGKEPVYGISDPKYAKLGDEQAKEHEDYLRRTGQKDKIKRVQTEQTTALNPVEAKDRAKKGIVDKDQLRTLTPKPKGRLSSGHQLSRLGEGRGTTYVTDASQTDPGRYNGAHADAEDMLPADWEDLPDRLGARRQQEKDKPLQMRTPPASQEDAEAVRQATGGLGTPDAVRHSARRLKALGVLTPQEQHKDAAKGLSASTSRPTDRSTAFTPKKPAEGDALGQRDFEEATKRIEYKVDKPNEGEIMSDESKSARTDTPSFDELLKSSVKDLAVMWNELLKSSDMEKAWADERSWSDDEAINDAIDEDTHNKYQHRADQLRRGGAKEETFSREADKHFADTDTEYVNSAIGAAQRADSDNAKLKSWGMEPNREVNVHEVMHKSEETNTVDQPNVIQKSFKEIMDEGSEKKIGTMGTPAGSNPYGYPLGGISMPIMNGYQQVFISREDRVMPTVGQMKHTKN